MCTVLYVQVMMQNKMYPVNFDAYEKSPNESVILS